MLVLVRGAESSVLDPFWKAWLGGERWSKEKKKFQFFLSPISGYLLWHSPFHLFLLLLFFFKFLIGMQKMARDTKDMTNPQTLPFEMSSHSPFSHQSTTINRYGKSGLQILEMQSRLNLCRLSLIFVDSVFNRPVGHQMNLTSASLKRFRR